MSFRQNRRRASSRRNTLRLESLESRDLMSITPGDPPPVVDPTTVANIVHLPAQHNLFDYDGFLTAPSSQSPVTIAEQYLRTHAAQLGMLPSDVDNYRITTNYVTKETGHTTLTFQQTLNGLPVAKANINIAVMPDGRILSVMGGFVSGLSARANQISSTPALSSSQALTNASSALGWPLNSAPTVLETFANGAARLSAPGVSQDEIRTSLQYVAMPGNNVSLAWQMKLRTPDGDDWYNVSVDTTSGQLVSLGNYVAHAGYEVYAVPKTDPDDSPRTVETDPHLISPTPAIVPSPFGWHDTNGAAGADFTITRGNNANAYADRDDDDAADPGSQPNGGATLDFTGALVPVDLTQAPSTYTAAAVVNLFYWTNINHDIHYLYGFDEVARNFQTNNYGRGGLAADAVAAEAQDGGGTDNANFATPPDGEIPRMQMFEFTQTIDGTPLNPFRDGDFANEIITHEYGHGVSNRLTGNGDGLNAIQSAGMGEGWSDFWSLMFTQEAASETTVGRGVGTYALGEPPTGLGIRDFKYDFDITDPALETFTHYNTANGPQVHTSGTRWAAVLWDINKLLIDKYGFEPNVYNVANNAGNIRALKLVTTGLKIQPLDPTFIQARDAILLADQMLFGGENRTDLWTAFARRGLGKDAATDDADSFELTTSFEVPLFPVAVPDSATLDTFTSTVIDVLANDFHQDPALTLDPTTVAIVSGPGNGTATVDPVSGRVTYTPIGAFFGTDTFSYTVRDSAGALSNRATVTVLVNARPIAINDTAPTDEGVAVDVAVLANDIDLDGTLDPTSVEILSDPANGTVTLDDTTGIVTYTPNPGFQGADSITYRMRDNRSSLSNVATVVFKVGDLHTLSGKVYVDLNDDGLQNGNDWPIEGVTVYVEKTDGSYTYTDLYITEADGSYTFTDLVTGTYNLREVHPVYFVDGPEVAGTIAPATIANDKFTGIAVSGGVSATGYNFTEEGLSAQFAAAYLNRKAYFSTGEGNSFDGLNLGQGDAWVAFSGGVNGQLQATAFGSGGSVTLTLYDQNMKQLAKSATGSGLLTYSAQSNQPVLLKVSGTASNASVSTFVIPPAQPVVPPPPKSWHNTGAFAEDVDGDGVVEPQDVLIAADAIRRYGIGSLTSRLIGSNDFLDVDNDGLLTPADVLPVIDRVNRDAVARMQTASGLLASSESSASQTHDIAFALAIESLSDEDLLDPIAKKKRS